MAKKKSRVDETFVFFDIIYEDGARSSRRKISAVDLAEGDGDDHAKTVIMSQDRKIAEMSDRHRGPIKSIVRSSL